VRLPRAVVPGPVLVGAALSATLLSAVGVAAVAVPHGAGEGARARAEAALPPEPLAALPVEASREQADRDRGARPAGAAAAAPAVAPLAALRVPDLLVTAPRAVTPEQEGALAGARGVQGVVVVDTGTVRLAGRDVRVLGVDPSRFRAFTPQESASSDPLWQAVARGEAVPSYGLARSAELPLGGTVVARGPVELSLRVGAVAAFGLPGVDLVTDRANAQRLGAAPSSAVVVSAPELGLTALRQAVRSTLGADAEVTVLRARQVAAARSRPTTYRELYVDSARYCPGLSWTVLAAIGQVESAHGRHLGPSSAGALGPMQFLPSTWEAYGLDGDGDGEADIMSPFDAVPSAAAYLCRFGAARGEQGLYDAIWMYNHADWYVQKVLGLAARYR
jgi:hypothetical protein